MTLQRIIEELENIMNQLKIKGKLSEKQMAGLNKVYKKYMKMKENKDV